MEAPAGLKDGFAASGHTPLMNGGKPITGKEWRLIIERAPLEFEIVGDSMVPTLRHGDRVLVEPLKRKPVKNDILVYLGSRPIIHRYLGNQMFRGDNRRFRDPRIAPDQIIGIVRYRIRNGRKIPVKGGLSGKARLNRMILYMKGAGKFLLGERAVRMLRKNVSHRISKN